MSIKLDLRTGLAKVRAAFDAGQLEAQLGTGRCTYTGPCAVGVMVTPDERVELQGVKLPGGFVGSLAVGTLCGRRVIEIPEDQQDDLVELQDTHDSWSKGGESTAADFLKKLIELEAKYVHQS